MAMKFFTNAFKGNASDSIAINPQHVITVFETVLTNHETNEISTVTNIYAGQNGSWQVEEDYLTVVARLNERD
jgi:hypothetical protein